MKKISRLLLMCMSIIPFLATIACEPNDSNLPVSIKVPQWVNTMVEKNKNQFQIGYDNYYLKSKSNVFDPHGWVDLDKNNQFFLYFPNSNSLDNVIDNLKINDTALTTTIGVTTPINWIKSDLGYTNNEFITEDTQITGISLMDVSKYSQIWRSNSDTWTSQEKEMYEEYASFGGGSRGDRGQGWWVSNGWDKLLNCDKTIVYQNKKYSQYDVFNKWIHQDSIGMNVSLSLIDKNSFILSKTNLADVYCLTVNVHEPLINNKGNIYNVLTPHWGFTVVIKNDNKNLFYTPELVHLKNSFKNSKILNYLQTSHYYSFNDEENKMEKIA